MSIPMSSLYLEKILNKAGAEQQLHVAEIIFLLGIDDEAGMNRLFHAAQQIRHKHFRNKLFLYGFVYFSTFCQNDCTFCYYRKSNSLPKRYRKSYTEILDAALSLAESGVHLIDLTMGEDPFFQQQEDEFYGLLHLVSELKDKTGLPVMVSPGVVSQKALDLFAQAGADWYACYQENFNRQLFKQLRVNQSYEWRMLAKHQALKTNLLVEEGMLLGVGESLQDIALGLQEMGRLKAQQVRVMSFVAQEGIPLRSKAPSSLLMELKVIAILRLLFPDRLIPASLDVDGLAGMEARVKAGANVITSIIPPSLGLMGVAQNTKDIDEGQRTVQGVMPLLERMGLEVASLAEYRDWIEREKGRLQ